jgi:hypothetical protein
MKKFAIGAVVLMMAFFVGMGLAGADRALAGSPRPRQGEIKDDHKVTLCHARDAHKNPYGPKAESIDKSAVFEDGHDGHNGGIWYQGIADHSWGDIIPPFDYEEWDGNSWVVKQYPGKNWPDGEDILDNDCQIPGDENGGSEDPKDPKDPKDPIESARISKTFGQCGETTFKAKQTATKPVNNMYLVVEAGGNVQAKNLPANGDKVSIKVGPFETDTLLRWRIFGGGERDYDMPLWKGYKPGKSDWRDSINEYIYLYGLDWTNGNADNPYTTWYKKIVEGCPADDNGGEDPGDDNGENPEPPIGGVDDGKSARSSRMWLESLTCEDLRVRAKVEVKFEDNPDDDVQVTFKYGDKTVTTKTDKDGRAGASFDYTGEDDITAEIDKYGKKHLKVKTLSCDSQGDVLGTATDGQVLAAETMAETGVAADMLMSVLGLEGVVSTAVGALLYAKKRQ